MRSGERLLDSFDQVFASYYVVVLRYAQRRLPNLQLAEDIAAETFTAAWSHWLSHHEAELPWLFRVASNKITDHYRGIARKQAIDQALLRAVEEPQESLEELDRIALRQALLMLPSREREAVMLTYWEGLSASEVAKVLACSTTVVWAILSRARRKLRGLLDVPFEAEPNIGGVVDEG